MLLKMMLAEPESVFWWVETALDLLILHCFTSKLKVGVRGHVCCAHLYLLPSYSTFLIFDSIHFVFIVVTALYYSAGICDFKGGNVPVASIPISDLLVIYFRPPIVRSMCNIVPFTQ